MSIQLIQRYYAEIDKIIRYGGSRNESSLRKAFQDLLEQYARAKGLVLVAEIELETKRGTRIRPDGVLKDALRQDWGYWESKDERDDIEAEIKLKFSRGYPSFNILFEDTRRAVIYQGGEEVLRADFTDAKALDLLLTKFVNYEPKEVSEFHKAIELFSAEVSGLAKVLREIIEEQVATNQSFQSALNEFLELARKAINPKVEMADVREMIIQHVLTEDIFMRVFDEAEFHRENVIAHKLAEVAGTFYKGDTKKNILARIKPYYETINARASQISDHHEKQKFLKALYQSFYKAYNPKAADRLGIVYTPDEIVRFMIESADHLVYKHFGKTLGDKGVEILDPATGTGTFITELIEYLPPQQLEYKYDHELHCNEVSILPYYIANLNIEYTYKQKTGKFNEFENICFVDTLDNMGFEHTGKQLNFFGMTDANAERILQQNSKPIMLVIGNPPYNAHQINANEDNPNRKYPDIDQRIQKTYVKYSKAQNLTKLYDMYTRFLRWASDRLDKDGVIAFVSNSSFINARIYDGFRKIVAQEFNEIYVIDLKGDARTSGERRKKEGGNIFSDQIRVGVAIYFLVRKEGTKGCKIFYNAVSDYATAEDKKSYLGNSKLSNLNFRLIHPSKNYDWINVEENDWEELLPVITKQTKESNLKASSTIFKNFHIGVVTARDEWVTDYSIETLKQKMQLFVTTYHNQLSTQKSDTTIKWSRNLRRNLERAASEEFNKDRIKRYLYRPFVSMVLYDSNIFINDRAILKEMGNRTNSIICFTAPGSEKAFMALGSEFAADFHLVGAGSGTQCLPLYHYNESDGRVENITDWALGQFQKQYKDKKITKEDIFHYVYAVLHHPAYRAKYEINLKREFPRIPFYEDPSSDLRASFWKWADWGKRLMDLHLNYETVEPYLLERGEREGKAAIPNEGMRQPACRLIARKEQGIIEVDTSTTLRGVPAEAWEYRLGTYSALEWILERYKEKKPKDPTIAEKFNTYRFANYKEQVIDLLQRVCTVSVETMKIMGEMPH